MDEVSFQPRTSAEVEITHVARRDTTSSILVRVMAKMPLLTEPGVACAVDIVSKAAKPACRDPEWACNLDVGGCDS